MLLRLLRIHLCSPPPALWCSHPLPNLFADNSDEEEHPPAKDRRAAHEDAAAGAYRPAARNGTPGSSAASLAGPLGEHFAGGGMPAALAGAAAEAVHGIAGELAPGAGMGANAPSGSSRGRQSWAWVVAGRPAAAAAAAGRQQGGAGEGEGAEEPNMDREDSFEITGHTKREVRR